jgi:acyl carrier protein
MLTPQEGLAVLQHQLRMGDAAPPQSAGIRLHLDRLSETATGLPLFEVLLSQASESETTARHGRRFLQQYQATPEAERQGLVMTHLQQLAARTLGIDDAGSISGDVALFSLGLDSLTTLELRNAMEASFERQIPATLVFDHPTLESLAEHFVVRLSASQQANDDQIGQPRTVDAGDGEATDKDDTSEASRSERVDDLVQSIQELNAELAHWEADKA